MRATAAAVALVFLLATPVTHAGLPNLSGTQWKTTAFADDFLGASGAPPSSANWLIDVGTSYPGGPPQWGTGEVESYTNSPTNVRQSGMGGLWLIPIRSASGAWTSGRVETVSSQFQAPAGGKMRIEAGIMMPAVTPTNGLGYWPAFYTLGGNLRSNYTAWPSVGEFDIMENVNALDSVNYGMHCGVEPDGACNEPTGLTQRTACPNSNCNGNWHTYTIVVDRSITPEAVRFYVDGQLNKAITETQVGNATWVQAVHHGHFIVLDMAMGGAYPNVVSGLTTPTAATISGAEMRIDYVAVWYT